MKEHVRHARRPRAGVVLVTSTRPAARQAAPVPTGVTPRDFTRSSVARRRARERFHASVALIWSTFTMARATALVLSNDGSDTARLPPNCNFRTPVQHVDGV